MGFYFCFWFVKKYIWIIFYFLKFYKILKFFIKNGNLVVYFLFLGFIIVVFIVRLLNDIEFVVIEMVVFDNIFLNLGNVYNERNG